MPSKTKVGGLNFFCKHQKKKSKEKMQEEKEKDCDILFQSF
jgi:hypothetical protein